LGAGAATLEIREAQKNRNRKAYDFFIGIKV
jgi:hypothetical protein